MGKRGRPGTGVEALADTIRVSFTLNGERCRETLDLPPTNPNLKYATRLVADIKDKIRLGVFDYAAAFPNSKRVGTVKSRLTVADYADQWLAAQVAQKSTLQSYRSGLAYWKEKFGTRPLDAITAMEIRQAVVERAEHSTAKTINNVLIPLRGLYALALEDGLVTRDPTASVKALAHQKPEPDPFTRLEMELILGWMQQKAPVKILYWYTLAFLTGLRPSEQRVLRADDFNAKDKTLLVERAMVRGVIKPTKTYSVRNVDLTGRAMRVIEALTKDGTTYLFGDRPPTDDDFKDWLDRYWYPCLTQLGLRRRIAYHTRHTFATVALMAGANPAYIARQLGHKNMQMLLTTYAKWIDQADAGRERAKLESAFDIVHNLSTPTRNANENNA